MQGILHLGWLFAARDSDYRFDAAAHVKVAHNFNVLGFKQCVDCVADVVGDFFVKVAFIAKRPQIKLERFEFDTVFAGHIADFESGKVWLPRDRTETGEFRAVKLNEVGLAVGVFKTLKRF